MSSNKAITDQSPLRIIKAIFPIIVHSVKHIVNLILSTGQFPDSCKLAVVSPNESNKLLCIHQYGFRKNYSTTYLTLDMFDKIFDDKSKGNTPALIFLS